MARPRQPVTYTVNPERALVPQGWVRHPREGNSAGDVALCREALSTTRTIGRNSYEKTRVAVGNRYFGLWRFR